MQGIQIIQNPGATQGQIDNLPTDCIQRLPHSEEAAKCIICLMDFTIGDTVRTLPCSKF